MHNRHSSKFPRWSATIKSALLAAVARMLPPGGTLIIAEPLSGLAATAPGPEGARLFVA